jgi:hypothetical protein
VKKILKKAKILFIPCEENKYKPRFLESQVLFYWILSLLILKLIAISFIYYFPKTVFFADLTKTALIQLTNQERQSLGLPTLKENPQLTQAAYQKAADMLAQDYFSHWSPTGVSPWYWFKKEGYNYQIAGENLAIGFLDSDEVVRAWLNSPSHRDNLLNPNFQEIGLAVLKGDFQGSETTVVVQLFAKPISKAPAPAAVSTPSVEATKIIPKEKEPPKVTKVTEGIQEEKPAKISEENLGGQATKPETIPVVGSEVASEFQLVTTQPETEKSGPSLNFFKFMSLDYPDILQKIIFYSLLLITLSLILNIFIKIHIQDKRLILKTTVFIVLLILFVLSDKELIINLIPHNLLI